MTRTYGDSRVIYGDTLVTYGGLILGDTQFLDASTGTAKTVAYKPSISVLPASTLRILSLRGSFTPRLERTGSP